MFQRKFDPERDVDLLLHLQQSAKIKKEKYDTTNDPDVEDDWVDDVERFVLMLETFDENYISIDDSRFVREISVPSFLKSKWIRRVQLKRDYLDSTEADLRTLVDNPWQDKSVNWMRDNLTTRAYDDTSVLLRGYKLLPKSATIPKMRIFAKAVFETKVEQAKDRVKVARSEFEKAEGYLRNLEMIDDSRKPSDKTRKLYSEICSRCGFDQTKVMCNNLPYCSQGCAILAHN